MKIFSAGLASDPAEPQRPSAGQAPLTTFRRAGQPSAGQAPLTTFRRAAGSGTAPAALAMAALALAALLGPDPAGAQLFSDGRFSIEPRFGVAFPTGDFGNVDPECAPGETGCDYPTQIGTETGWLWEIAAHYALTEAWSLLARYGQANLDCSPNFCDFDDEAGTRFVGLGVRGTLFPLGSMDIWVEGGGVYEEVTIIRTRDLVGEPISREVAYPWSPGFFGGVGASLPLRADEDLFLTPGFRFHYVPADPPDSDSELNAVDANYFVAEVGVRIVVGR